MKLRLIHINANSKDPRNWFEHYIDDDLTVYDRRSKTWGSELPWRSSTPYRGTSKTDLRERVIDLDAARRQALLSLPNGAWLAYQDGGAGQIIKASLDHCVIPDLFPTIANYLVAHTPLSLPTPAADVHMCVAREYDFTDMTTDVTPKIIAECRRNHGQWYIGAVGRASCVRDAEMWKIAGRSDVTFEYHTHTWTVYDNETTYMTQCSHIHSLLLSQRRSRILYEMWADVDLPDKSEIEYMAFKQAFEL